MPVKKAAPAKKATAIKKPAAKVAAKKSKALKQGDSLECEVCGLIMTVDEECGCVEVHEILCCEEPMKRAVKAK